jgi:hypothetical protein
LREVEVEKREIRGREDEIEKTKEKTFPPLVSILLFLLLPTFGWSEGSEIGFSLATTRRGKPGGGRSEGSSRSEGASGGEAKRRTEFLLLLLPLLL